ncbi:MAG: alanine--tRNA ligase [Candidatus Wallbacteria bacterium]|nr:alanine--tRNA ligase [Candidatus Wallbacteria bacterium]
MTGSEIREKFLKFFEEKKHLRVKSSSLIPQGDKTLLFTNAGMVQFKSVFTGEEKRESRRAASSQKCVRAGGKHNDLESVGITARHHTFFEMLGNFSFGDYFKEDAIAWAWELLTGVYGLPKDKLWITVFREDDEAASIWEQKIGVRPERIVRMDELDNFWSMGDTGPCGPCSEIHIDQGSGVGCGKPGCDIHCGCDRFLEIWNLVFMQFDKKENGEMTKLPKPSIDTGMGLERLTAVIQGKHSNYETDLIFPIIERISKDSGAVYGSDLKKDTAMRVLADHIRAMSFLICDGVLPSNEGRGYVLRRIMRRAKRYQERLEIEGEYLYQLFPEVIRIMKDAYPELIEKIELISKIIRLEEEKFALTLRKGRSMIEELIAKLKAENQSVLPGFDAFKLYDTFGFPLEMSKDIFAEAGFAIDEPGFNEWMEKQKTMGQASWKKDEALKEYQEWAVKHKPTEFLGYDETSSDSSAILDFDDQVLLLDRTPFYAESGGQTGDTGTIEAENFRCIITDTRKSGSVYLHFYETESGSPVKNAKVKALVDEPRRAAIRFNHSATHMLQAALRQVLGSHVQQTGSFVDDEKLRFDFKHFAPLTLSEIRKTEEIVNRKIWEMLNVTTMAKSLHEAKSEGALAFFEEKYGQVVRVVKMGDFSTELCGGTHVHNSGEIGLFKIISETGIAASMRRIEAVTHERALKIFKDHEHLLSDLCSTVKSQNSGELLEKIQSLQTEKKDLERKVEELKARLAGGDLDSVISGSPEVSGAKIVAKKFQDLQAQELRSLADRIIDRVKGIAILGSDTEGKAALVVKVSKELSGKVKAGDLIREIARLVDGTGGGKPDLAQAGGKSPAKIQAALDRGIEIAKELLK